MVVLRTFIAGNGVPVIATGTDTNDSSVFRRAQEFPRHYGIVASGDVVRTGLLAEDSPVSIPTPVSTYMVLGGRVGDAVALIAGIDMVGSIVIHQQVLPQRMVGMTCDSELPRASCALSLVLFLSPAVIREALRFAQVEWQIDRITRQEERTATLVELFEFVGYQRVHSLRSIGFKSTFTLQTSVLMEMPPDHLTVSHHHATQLEVLKRSIIGVFYVSQQPVDSFLLFRIELRYRFRQSQIEEDRITFLLDGDGVRGRSGVIGNREIHRIGKIARHATGRRDSCAFCGLDGRYHRLDIGADRNGHGDGVRRLVHDTDIGVIEHERENTRLVVLDAHFIIQIHIAVLYMHDNRRCHIHFVTLLRV